ncbi:alpha-crystallin A chain [Monomorium pharaonis]|uniref:alpha-crystallin A chain n=1 Tax=Monomorium pharaonis TaxID=307658 RepID=UPI00063F8B5B|nr:alpha-crystallin A chain [Monomorium pharaonis]
MALSPFVFYDWENMLCHPILNPTLGLELRQPKRMSLPAETIGSCLRPQRNYDLDQLRNMLDLATRHCQRSSALSINENDFQVMLDVQQFEPEEIEVKVVDNYLIITAKHGDKRDDHGWVSRQFVRRYQLPEDISVEHLSSKLSSDGLLTIVAPKIQSLKDETNRALPIEFTGKPFMKEKQKKSKMLQQSEEEKKLEK